VSTKWAFALGAPSNQYNPEQPCRSCSLTNSVCTYAPRDRKVIVPESYLRRLEGAQARPAEPEVVSPVIAEGFAQQRPLEDTALGPACSRPSTSAAANYSTAEQFVSRLKQVRDFRSTSDILDTQTESPTSARIEESALPSTRIPQYEYFELEFDTTRQSSQAFCRFPPADIDQTQHVASSYLHTLMWSIYLTNFQSTSVTTGTGSGPARCARRSIIRIGSWTQWSQKIVFGFANYS
jgi:hypothetical protein